MTYWTLNAVFLAVSAVPAVVLWLQGRRPGAAPRALRPVAKATGATALVLFVLTVVFDNVMISAGLFSYAPELISGWTIGLAPVEDFAYIVGAALLLPSLWTLLSPGTAQEAR
ncbi:lycopene cyclase domain-containing protein [Arthrobacter sp. 35W]|uniref:lycopene cyclase domain-containing protein n=1 Tax=Arthrobacter sp. 35W TaxID=1132441 RepID=UPI000423EB84|nr:lycopene cyclase domain-containing protein [Arthrobacter sp. 35W]